MSKVGRWLAPLTADAFNQLVQYANRTECYTELAVSFLLMAIIITSAHSSHLWSDEQAVIEFDAIHVSSSSVQLISRLSSVTHC